jgi:glycosyltransferase involved in cell wall biosynthesis
VNNVLRLAVDARDLASDTRGIGRYARAILRRLVLRDDIELTLLVFGPFAFRHRAKMRAALGSNRFRLASHADKCDVVWHPANGTFFSADVPIVATIHDAVPFRFPDTDAQRRAHQQAPFLRSIRSASRIIAVSNFDKNELVEVFTLPAERVDVIYHGVDPFFSPGAAEGLPEQLREPYLLFVGDPLAEPRKNFQLLYDAYRRAFDSPDRPRLVVVGPTDPKLETVYYAGLAGEDAAGAGDARLRALYRGALALCVPSYYETFGMPMAEAMACGTPVIASHASCLPEIAGDAALYAPPHDGPAWSDALARMVSDTQLRERLRGAGLQHAQRYNWDESARRHAEVFFAT